MYIASTVSQPPSIYALAFKSLPFTVSACGNAVKSEGEVQRDVCLALADWQSLCIKPLTPSGPTCGDAETHVFAHKLLRMHAHARTGTNKTHTQRHKDTKC